MRKTVSDEHVVENLKKLKILLYGMSTIIYRRVIYFKNLPRKLAHAVTRLTLITEVSNSDLGSHTNCLNTHSIT